MTSTVFVDLIGPPVNADWLNDVNNVVYNPSVPNLTGPITSVGTATTIVGPIPSVSLSGTISGGGNQINNVVIGTTTPLAGKFTSLAASTTLNVTGVSTLTGGAVIQGLTVGVGAYPNGTNTALGASALASSALGGNNNTANGYLSLYSNTVGNSNTAVGAYAMQGNRSGLRNTAIGLDALAGNISTNNNTAIGAEALLLSSGASNIGLGYNAGSALTTGDNNTIIGSVTGTAGLADTVIISAGTAERMRVNSSGTASFQKNLLLGGPTSSAFAHGVQMYGTAVNGSANAIQWQYSADSTAATLLLVKTRGSSATDVTLVSNNDTVGTIAFCPTNGITVCTTGLVYAKIAGVTSATSLPTSLGFSTTPTGAIAASTRMLIDPDGTLNVYANVKVNQLSAIPAGGSTTQGLTFSSATNFGIYYGSGAPTLSAAQGSLYLRSDGTTTNNRMYVNTTGSTTWTAVTTVA